VKIKKIEKEASTPIKNAAMLISIYGNITHLCFKSNLGSIAIKLWNTTAQHRHQLYDGIHHRSLSFEITYQYFRANDLAPIML
jgi:hypothetical protein